MGADHWRDVPGACAAGAGRRPRRGSALAGGRALRRARRRAGHAEGKHRHARHADAAGQRRDGAGAGARRRPGCRAPARGRRDRGRQDHHAGLRLPRRGAVELPPADAQSVEPGTQYRRFQLGRGRGGSGRLWPDPPGHRYRRLGAHPRQLLRRVRPEAQPWPRAGVSAGGGARARPADAHRGRCRARHAGDRPARRPRLHEPAAAGHRLDQPGARRARAAHRPVAGAHRRLAGRPGSACRGAGGRARVRAGRRRGRAGARLDHHGHAHGAGAFFHHALPRRPGRDAAGARQPGRGLYPQGRRSRRRADAGADLPGLHPHPAAARSHRRGHAAL
ncbi:hypothetical protein D9M68_704070 [compost metagenome]